MSESKVTESKAPPCSPGIRFTMMSSNLISLCALIEKLFYHIKAIGGDIPCHNCLKDRQTIFF